MRGNPQTTYAPGVEKKKLSGLTRPSIVLFAIGKKDVVKVYVGGPMRKRPLFNHPLFQKVTGILRGLDYDVTSPHEIDVEHGFSPHDEARPLRDYLRYDIPALLECDIMALLPGWEDSDGTRAEMAVAEACDIPIIRWEELVEQHERFSNKGKRNK